MIRVRSVGSFSIGVILLIALSGNAVMAECTTLECCWSDLFDRFGDCKTEYGEERPDPLDEEMRSYGLQACFKVAGVLFGYCVGQLPPGERGPFWPTNLGVVVTTAVVGTAPDVYETEFEVLPSVTGTYLLEINNGGGPVTPEGRAAIEVRLDGVLIVSATDVNGSVSWFTTEVVLQAGLHQIEFRSWSDNEEHDWGTFNAVLSRVSTP